MSVKCSALVLSSTANYNENKSKTDIESKITNSHNPHLLMNDVTSGVLLSLL